MIEPGKNFPGQKGYPTPDDVPEEQGYIVFYFPDSNDWAGLLLGAAGQLAEHWNYFGWGALTPNEAAEAWKEIVNQAPYNILPATRPAPYWDDAEDSDDEMPNDTQPWYGTVEDAEAPPDELTFQENAAIWLVTGFLAFATIEVGAAPAIFFHTIAPRFVLAFRKGDLGEIIRVVIDSVEYGRVDTSGYSEDDIIEIPVLADPELEEHDLYVIGVPSP